MSFRWKSILQWVGVLAVCTAVIGVAVVVGPQVKNRFWPPPAEPSSAESSASSTELVSGQSGAIRLASGVAERLGVRTTEVQTADKPIVVELPGTLSFDADRLSHVHARFAGEVVEIGVVQGGSRPLDFGASVHKGQLLAVIWSRELGEKKSELVDALSQLHLDQENLNRLTQASVEGAVSERAIREAQRKVESDQIAVGRTVRTLQSWRVPPEEIDALRAEAESLRHDAKPIAEEHVHRWARSEVRAPLDGVILEKNIALGDLVDTNLDLFKIADLSRLRVMAHAYEEQLPLLDNLAESQRQWTISVQSDTGLPPLAGQIRADRQSDRPERTCRFGDRLGGQPCGPSARGTVHYGKGRIARTQRRGSHSFQCLGGRRPTSVCLCSARTCEERVCTPTDRCLTTGWQDGFRVVRAYRCPTTCRRTTVTRRRARRQRRRSAIGRSDQGS